MCKQKTHRIVVDITFKHNVTSRQAVTIVKALLTLANKSSWVRLVARAETKEFSRVVARRFKRIEQLETRVNQLQQFYGGSNAHN